MRSLVELAAIEIVGKLTRTPYWKCLNADRSNPDIANEIANWLYTMSVDHQLVPYMQKQLRLRNYYTGPVDGVVNDELLAAVARSHGDLGLPASSDVDLTYFSAFLDSTHVAERQQAAVARPTPLRLTIASDHRPGEMKKGQVYALQIRPSRDAHVYCYLQDDDGNIQRFYPNRFAQDSLVKADSGLELPGHMRFQLVASQKGGPETVACFAAERDVLSAVPATISGTDFVSIGARSMNEVHGAFAAAASGNLGEAYFNVKPN